MRGCSNYKLYLMLFLLFLSSCSWVSNPSGNVALLVDNLPSQVAQLPPVDETTISTPEQYISFADKTNDLIKILNEKEDVFTIPYLKATSEEWDKISNKITEYSPLIKNYNETITAARQYNQSPTPENRKQFYIAGAKFGAEAGFIASGFLYSPSYEATGEIYRFTRLNTLAFDCGSCTSIILSGTHWGIRTYLAEKTSDAMDYAQEKWQLLNVTQK